MLESTGKVLIENTLYFQNLGVEVHFTMAIMQWRFKLLIFKKKSLEFRVTLEERKGCV